MREIKFRAWHTVHNKMYEPKGIDVLLKNVGDDNIWKFMQFTGLKDKNGKDIYEGDIVKSKGGSVSQIVWDDRACFSAQTLGTISKANRVGIVGKYMGIIGNIYEHPHLLNSEQEPEVSDTTKMPNERDAGKQNPAK